MDTKFESRMNELREKAFNIGYKEENWKKEISMEFQQEFFALIDQVNFSLIEDKDNFFGYFLFQLSREIRFDISSPTAVNFKGAGYVLYFNPIIFLKLRLSQMESLIKHEILHILSMHHMRAKLLKDRYSTLAINLAMDCVVNKYLNNLPPYAITIERVNVLYSLNLKHQDTFEHYVELLQNAIDLLPKDIRKEAQNQELQAHEEEFQVEHTHDIWDESIDIDDRTLQEFTEKVIQSAGKGQNPAYVNSMISDLKNSRAELPWNLYLNQLMGTVESNKKKTITRRDRRQPDRFDLRGELRSHKAKIAVAIDISGSISDEEFRQAMKEVLEIVKNYNHEVTIIECDDEIRRVYKVSSIKDLKDRINTKGSTRFNPVFEYVNRNQFNLLVFFTDGKGEEKLHAVPGGYRILWVISGRGEELSLRDPVGVVKRLSNIDGISNGIDTGNVARGGYSMNHQEEII